MKTVKSILVLSILLVSCISFAQPQGGVQRSGQQGPPPIPNTKQINEMVSNLSKEISLTKEQEASVLNLYTTHFEEVKAKTSGNSKPKREEMEALRVKFENSVKALLSKEQQSKYTIFLEQHNPQNQKR